MIARARRFIFRAALGNSVFTPDMLGGRSRSLTAMGRNRLATVEARKGRPEAPRATRTGEFLVAAPDQISSAGGCADRSRRDTSKSQTRTASMKINAVRLVAGLALAAFVAPSPAAAQYFPPILMVVPPPAQNYATPKPAPKPQPPKPKPDADISPSARPAGHYQGQTFVPD
jgi:hypothetical protein